MFKHSVTRYMHGIWIISFFSATLLAYGENLFFIQRFYTRKNVNNKVTGMKWMPGKEKLWKYICNDAFSFKWYCVKMIWVNDIMYLIKLCPLHFWINKKGNVHTWTYNKFHELATVCLPWQQWIKLDKTVNQLYYLEVLKRLREKVRRKRPELFANNSWILHHDNAPAHTALSLRECLATKQITVLEHPEYSPDLAPNDFFSVPEDKRNVERKAFWWHWWHQC